MSLGYVCHQTPVLAMTRGQIIRRTKRILARGGNPTTGVLSDRQFRIVQRAFDLGFKGAPSAPPVPGNGLGFSIGDALKGAALGVGGALLGSRSKDKSKPVPARRRGTGAKKLGIPKWAYRDLTPEDKLAVVSAAVERKDARLAAQGTLPIQADTSKTKWLVGGAVAVAAIIAYAVYRKRRGR